MKIIIQNVNITSNYFRFCLNVQIDIFFSFVFVGQRGQITRAQRKKNEKVNIDIDLKQNKKRRKIDMA